MRKSTLSRIIGLTIIGTLLIGMAVPMKCAANPQHWWRQTTPAAFDLDTMSDVHYYSHDASMASVHLVDDQAETEAYDYNPNNGQWDQIWEQNGVNGFPLGAYSQSFTPSIDGVVDVVQMRVWKVGNPVDANNNAATLTVEITDAVQSGIYQPILNTVEVQSTYGRGDISNQQQLNSFRLTDTDSDNSNPLTSGHIYTLYVTSTAKQDVNNPPQNYFAWGCSNALPVHDTTGTYGCTKWLNNQGGFVWFATGGGAAAYDHPFNVYVHNFVHSGNIVSAVCNCGGTSTFDCVLMDFTQGGTVTIYVRTGPNSNPPQSWSSWINEGTGSQNPGLTRNQYVQFEIDFIAGNNDLTTQGVRMVAIGFDTP